MEVRFAKREEYDQVLNIVKQVHNQHVRYRNDIFKDIEIPMLKEEYIELISKNNILVGIENGTVVGYAQISIRETKNPILCTRRILFIEAIAILNQFQKKGYGSYMVKYIKNYALKELCDSIELQVSVENDTALDFYFNNKLIEKEKRLEFKIKNN